MTSGHAYVGTSGWSYASWRPVFYPQEVKSKDLLRYYATRLKTLEINYTFNHLPTEKNIAGWREATPPEFLFALKASRQITHYRQLRAAHIQRLHEGLRESIDTSSIHLDLLASFKRANSLVTGIAYAVLGQHDA